MNKEQAEIYIEKRIIEEANYIIENKCTLRQAEKAFPVGKTQIHVDVTKKLKNIDYNLYLKVKDIIKTNKSEAVKRGGLSTKKLYKEGAM